MLPPSLLFVNIITFYSTNTNKVVLYYYLILVQLCDNYTTEPPATDPSNCQAYWRWLTMRVQTILGQNFASLKYFNYKDFPQVPLLMQCYLHVKSGFSQ